VIRRLLMATTLVRASNRAPASRTPRAHIGLFYCMLMPAGHALSLDRRAGRVPAGLTAGARLSLRVLQLHLCVVYLSSGFSKATGEQWWTGEAIWLAPMRPDLATMDFSWLARVPWLAWLACWGTLAVELGYPIFIWHRRTRAPMALATLGLHAGIAVALGLLSFSATMALLTTSAFLVSAKPRVEAASECGNTDALAQSGRASAWQRVDRCSGNSRERQSRRSCRSLARLKAQARRMRTSFFGSSTSKVTARGAWKRIRVPSSRDSPCSLGAVWSCWSICRDASKIASRRAASA
jgi:hypothetical protein